MFFWFSHIATVHAGKKENEKGEGRHYLPRLLPLRRLKAKDKDLKAFTDHTDHFSKQHIRKAEDHSLLHLSSTAFQYSSALAFLLCTLKWKIN